MGDTAAAPILATPQAIAVTRAAVVITVGIVAAATIHLMADITVEDTAMGMDTDMDTGMGTGMGTAMDTAVVIMEVVAAAVTMEVVAAHEILP